MTSKQEWMKTVSGVVITATAVLFMFAVGDVARGDTITREIQVQNDDVEEYLNTEAIHGWGGEYVQGNVYLNSSDLEVGDDGGGGLFWQAVAVQYDQLGIPQGAIINSAKLTFQVDEAYAPFSSNDFTILAEAADNAAVFSGSGEYGTPFDVTNRARSVASVGWNPPTSAGVGSKVDTADIFALIQEVVNRPGWSDNNRLTLMIYPDAYLALPDPTTGGWTTVSSNTYEGGPGADSATLTVDFVPEPSTLVLLGMGALGLLLFARRKRA